MKTDRRLSEALRAGYAVQVMGSGTQESALAQFARHADEDPEFIDAAKAELNRCTATTSRRTNSSGASTAFVEQQYATFLKAALDSIEKAGT